MESLHNILVRTIAACKPDRKSNLLYFAVKVIGLMGRLGLERS
jgi:hypothetical protein